MKGYSFVAVSLVAVSFLGDVNICLRNLLDLKMYIDQLEEECLG